MKAFIPCVMVLVLAAGALAQTSSTTTTTTTPKKKRRVGTQKSEVQVLREEMQQQQQQFQQELQQRDQQLNQMQQQMQQMQQQVQQTQSTANDTASKVDQFTTEQKATTTKVQSDLSDVKTTLTNQALNTQEAQKQSPLSFRIGQAEFTPSGFVDFENIFRSTNTGNSVGTNFFAIPFSNTVAGHLTEFRQTAQHSRFGLKVADKFGANDVTGYIEADFNGNDAANVFVSTNPHTARLRLYWVDVRRNKWEFLAGQSWSMLEPNRNAGMSALPSNVWVGLETDANAHVGVPYVRAAGVRFIYHPTDNWAVGVALENPEQFGGQGEVTFPTAFNAQLSGQIDQANLASTPNLHPDIIPKVTYDKTFGSRKFHWGAAGLLRSFKITDLVGPTFAHHTTVGGGVESDVNIDVVKNLKFIGSGFWSEGGGRYIFGMAPDVAVQPLATDVDLELVETAAAFGGLEWQATPHNQIYAYGGGMYADREAFLDNTAGTPPNHFVGFGGPNSANNNNRDVQEYTLGWIHTIWSDQIHGAVTLNTSYSYVTRAPWFVPSGAPKNAHLGMVYLDLRYVLP